MIHIRRRLVLVFSLLMLLFAIGTAGYIWLEDYSLVDAFYMTAISLTTVGFGEVRPLSSNGRLFTILIILLGVGTVTYGFSTFIEYMLTADVAAQLRQRRLMRTIEKYHDHVIVCGYGRVGQSTVETLGKSKRDIIIVDKDPEMVANLLDRGFVVIEGDATKDDVLLHAGIERAWGLIVATGDDSLNLFIVLSARALHADLFIVTRSIAAENEGKMRRAGADRVVSPYQIGGKHMANIMIRPHVTDFFDVVTLDGGVELWIEELIIAPDSSLVGQTIGSANIRRQTGVSVVALFSRENNAAMVPQADTLLQAGDEVIVLGTREQLVEMEKLLGVTVKPAH